MKIALALGIAQDMENVLSVRNIIMLGGRRRVAGSKMNLIDLTTKKF